MKRPILRLVEKSDRPMKARYWILGAIAYLFLWWGILVALGMIIEYVRG